MCYISPQACTHIYAAATAAETTPTEEATAAAPEVEGKEEA